MIRVLLAVSYCYSGTVRTTDLMAVIRHVVFSIHAHARAETRESFIDMRCSPFRTEAVNLCWICQSLGGKTHGTCLLPCDADERK